MASADQRFSPWPIVTLIVAVLCLIIAMPTGWKPWAPGFLKPEMHLGLDLAGGTQLDFRVSEDEMDAREEELQTRIDTLRNQGEDNEVVLAAQFELQNVLKQHQNIVEAIRTVLERRINSLGVSEATITPSYFGSEKHLLVECPGIIDVNRCIATVGKTIQLEFKEEFSGATLDFEEKIREKADRVYRSVTTGTGNLQVYGQDLSSTLGVSYFDIRPLFVSNLPKGLEALARSTTKDPVLKAESTIQTTVQNAQGQTEIKEIRGIYLAQVLVNPSPAVRTLTDPNEALLALKTTVTGATLDAAQATDVTSVPDEIANALRTMDIGSTQVIAFGTDTAGILYLSGRTEGTEQMAASHILLQYKGAQRADATVTRTREEAGALALKIKQQLNAGADFATLARTKSDGPSRQAAGSLGIISRGMMVSAFEGAAFALTQGQISDVVETPFGFHIIRADKAPAVSGAKVTYDLLRFKGNMAEAKDRADKVDKGQITRVENQMIARILFFSLEPTGWKDTDLSGRRFRSAAVSFDPITNVPVVQIQFDDEGGKLFQQLTKRNIDKRIAIFVGGELVSAPVVNHEIIGGNAIITGSRSIEEAQNLATDLNTGAIPAPIYLSGQTTVEATLGANALHQSVTAAAIGLLILCLFLIFIYRLLGVMASLALIFYVLLLLASTKLPIGLLSNQYVVLTLAGIAGIILSMGMAVDANVLAFERVKEELRKGKLYRTAVDTGFRKAWPSVRDGNTSTLITCAILFTIGTSIIRGFAVTLSIGIFLSLFTAIVVSRWLCRKLADSPLAERLELFGVRKEEVSKQT